MIGHLAPAKIKGEPNQDFRSSSSICSPKHFQSQPLLLGCGQFITRDGKRLRCSAARHVTGHLPARALRLAALPCRILTLIAGKEQPARRSGERHCSG
jgi:hypothetical protein